jgi:hypothetical protein
VAAQERGVKATESMQRHGENDEIGTDDSLGRRHRLRSRCEHLDDEPDAVRRPRAGDVDPVAGLHRDTRQRGADLTCPEDRHLHH